MMNTKAVKPSVGGDTPLAVISAAFAAGRSEALKSLAHRRRSIIYGASGSAAAMALAALPVGRKALTALVIGADSDDAACLYGDLCRVAGDEAVAILPSGYRRSIKYGQEDEASRILRTQTLTRLLGETDTNHSPLRFIVSYPEALAERVASRDEVDSHTVTLHVGQSIDPKDLLQTLLDNGFSKVDYVYIPGQVAMRGGILDVFGFNDERPVRIDFFGDDVESIRFFDVETQLSDDKTDSVSIAADVTRLAKDNPSLLQFVDEKTLVAVRAGIDVCARVHAVAASDIAVNALTASSEDGMTLADIRADIVDADAFAERYDAMRRMTLCAAADPASEHSEQSKDSDTTKKTASIDLHCSPQGIYHKNFELITKSLGDFAERGYKIYILSDSVRQIQRLRDIFADRGDDITFGGVEGTLHEGFVDHEHKACVFTDHQIFDRFHKYTLRSERARSGRVALSLKELGAIQPGDYIVHVDHGVGRFAGLLRANVNGHTQEMIKLVYQNEDIVFVSIHALHKLSKYRGQDGEAPKLNKLGSGAWNRIKERTKSRLKDIARDLIRLYAARKDQQGHAFAPDSYMQNELEASFVYEDTPDQITATQAVKSDMESPRPMDRLICGDVGFGKTEIAVRAAFKAAVDGKQTAILVPTTVLAYQHYNTFSERLKDFPVRVEYLSRARSAKDTKAILADLAEGKIDIIIGTHKLIGKSVHFHDLGLLVIDEEQKFGVAVKERLKQMKVSVDTLTMSATPIPRTLQFSLMGARDLSSLTTPPANRYPIVTNVDTLSDDLLAEAIGFELARGGQVFIINNRIEGLYRLQNMVSRLVPDACSIVAHGQMPPEALEKAIIDFTNHDYDILIATTIIESGIDMPNVNTIIVNNAQNFGLSELHQLRGRVGRSSRKAFCYLLVPPDAELTSVARRRLQAIESFSDLGSGIHIAMQDLDIRGAGNLLGAEQSGFIADLGYETYQKILKEAVTELRTQEFADTMKASTDTVGDGATDSDDFVADTTVESDLELLLPADYVPQESERISLYRELDNIERQDDLEAFAARLIDRFGPIPAVARELLLVPRLRRDARRLGIEKVVLKNGKMYTYFVDASNIAYYQSAMFGRMLSYLNLNSRRVHIRENAGRRSFVIDSVPTVHDAVSALETALTLPVA